MDGMEKTELTNNHTQPEEEESRSPAEEAQAEEAQADAAQREGAKAEEAQAEEAMAMAAPSESQPEQTSEEAEMETMSELYEESLRRVQEGEVVTGRIVSITKEFVMVDIGYKSEGQIPIHEFTTPEGEITAQGGEEGEALMESRAGA